MAAVETVRGQGGISTLWVLVPFGAGMSYSGRNEPEAEGHGGSVTSESPREGTKNKTPPE